MAVLMNRKLESEAEKHGIRPCKINNCNAGPHFHVSIPSTGGKSVSIKYDEENVCYYMNHAHIIGYKKSQVSYESL